MDDNLLRELPSGVFSGLSLDELLLDGKNPGAPFTLRLNLRQEEGAFQFVIEIAQGALMDLTVTATIKDDTLKGDSTIMVMIPAGSVRSDPIAIKPTSETETVRVSLSNPSPLPHDFSGIEIEVGASLDFLSMNTDMYRTPSERLRRPFDNSIKNTPRGRQLVWLRKLRLVVQMTTQGNRTISHPFFSFRLEKICDKVEL